MVHNWIISISDNFLLPSSTFLTKFYFYRHKNIYPNPLTVTSFMENRNITKNITNKGEL